MSLILDGGNGITFPNGSNPQAAPSKVLQVINATYSTFVSSATSSFVDTGLTASITPLFSTSKILVLVNQNGGYKSSADAGNRLNLQLLANGSVISSFAYNYGYTASTLALEGIQSTLSYLHSPATTSSVTYKTQLSNGGGSISLVGVQSDNSISSIILMEIAQ